VWPNETNKNQSLTLPEAESLALRVLKQVMEEKLDEFNVQLARVTVKDGFKILSGKELKEIIAHSFPGDAASGAGSYTAAGAGSSSS